MRFNWKFAIVVALVLIGIQVATSNPKTPSADDNDRTLAQAMCDDLEDGMSLFQMHSQAVSYYRESRSENAAQSAAAHLEDLATRTYCPAFRDDFEATVVYEDWIE